MRKFRIVYIEMYFAEVYYIKCDRKQLRLACSRCFDDEMPSMPDTAEGGTFNMTKKGEMVVVVWVEKEQHLAHEIFHCADSILSSAGMSLVNGSEEAYAYLIGYLDNQLRRTK